MVVPFVPAKTFAKTKGGTLSKSEPTIKKGGQPGRKRQEDDQIPSARYLHRTAAKATITRRKRIQLTRIIPHIRA